MLCRKEILSLLVILGLAFNAAQAQNGYVDSLKKALSNRSISDLDRVDALIEIGRNLAISDQAQAVNYYMRAYRFADSKKNNFHKGRATAGIGNVYYYHARYDSALYFYHQADSLFATDTSAVSKASLVTNKASIGNIEVMKNDYESALKTFIDAIRVMEHTEADNKWLVQGILYGDIANIYHDLRQYDKALDYDLQGLAASKKQKDNLLNETQFEIYVAGDYADVNDMPKSKDHLEKAGLLAGKLQSPGIFYHLYTGWGDYYRKTDDLSKAGSSYQQALLYAVKGNSRFQQMNAYRMIGTVYRQQNRYEEGLQRFKQALKLAVALKNIKSETELFGEVADLENRLKRNDEAVMAYRRYIKLRDSANILESQKQINEIESKYQNRKKEDSISVLQKETQIQQLELHRKKSQNLFITVGAALLLLTGLLFYRNLRNRHRLLRRTEQLHEQQIVRMEGERQLVAAQSLMRGQEEERSRLAKDLHDGVGGLLSGVKLRLSNMKGNVFLSEENARAVTTIIDQLDSSIHELRRVSHNMMPEVLIKYGLKEALENYCEGIDQSGELALRLQTYGLEHRMEQDTEIILYRIVQELLNNVIKHADAKQVLVQLVRESDKFTLTVEDDGKGFDRDDPRYQKGAGLQNIQARTSYLNGVLDIRSKPGEGTSVTIEGKLA